MIYSVKLNPISMYYTPKERASKTAQDDVFEHLKIIRFSWIFLKEKALTKSAKLCFFKLSS